MEDRISREMSDVGIASTTGPRSGRKHLASESGDITYSMTLRDFAVLVTTTSSYDMTITLPSVSEARGKIYTIRYVGQDTTDTVTIQDKDDGRENLSMAATVLYSYIALYSDGYDWIVIGNDGGFA